MTSAQPITVAGAGAIGCFVGGILAAHGRKVTLLARPRVIKQIKSDGLHLTDFGALSLDVKPSQISVTDHPDSLAVAGVILVTVKTVDTRDIAAMIATFAPQTAIVVSLQNGLEAANILRKMLPGFDVRAGMVPFNIVPQPNCTFHRATSGEIVIEAGPTVLAGLLSTSEMPVTETQAITEAQWGKLLINLNNALNALSGLTLHRQLLSRKWRRVMAAQMVEALTVLRVNGIKPVSTTPLPSRMIPWVLRLPTPLFSRIASKMLTIDPKARTSMFYDLENGKPTEIDALQGAIIRLGKTASVPTPICERVSGHIKRAEKAGAGVPHFSPSDV
tara:strand:+ start:4689 stop:5684 length:996 start_codon:yes stop_codon:yes gene_type:complete